MSKAVLISIRPKWCELIASGKKTIEVRKTRPKLETPFKCYIYCTKPSYEHEDFIVIDAGTERARAFYGGGMVIGEFMCRTIEKFDSAWSEYAYAVAPTGSVMPMHEAVAIQIMKEKGCLTNDDITGYFWDEDYKASFWHISDLVIYDEPKALSEFCRPCPKDNACAACDFWFSGGRYEPPCCGFWEDDVNMIRRPPQSWCYVEQEGE